MKNYFNWLLTAMLTLGIGLNVTSCKSDDDDTSGSTEQTSTVSVDADLLSHGIETEMKSAAVDVKITSNGLWTATLAKGTDWVMIKDWQVTYEGPQTLTLLFDENTTGYDRTTQMRIGNSDGEYQTINIRQTAMIDGQAPKNANGLAFAGQGLGCGIDYDYALNVKNKSNTDQKFEPTKVKKSNNIFNIAQIEALQKSGQLQSSAYQETYIPLADLQAKMIDSSMVKLKDVNFNLTMSVNFSSINFSAHGNFVSKKTQTESAIDYIITRNAPMYNVVISPAEIRTFAADPKNNKLDIAADDAMIDQIDQLAARYNKINKRKKLTNLNAEGLTPEQADEINAMYDEIPKSYTWGGVFSANFTKAYNNLYTALKGKTVDKTAADQALNQIDNDFGPLFIAGGDFGGSIVVHCHALDRMLDGTGQFKGDLAAAVGGAFSVEGSFSYTETGIETLHDCTPNIYIYGGNADDTANSLWDIVMGAKLNDREKWSKTLKDWVNSLYSASDNKPNLSMAAPLSFVMEPIWTLFSDPAIQEYAQNYFLKKYEDRGLKGYLGIGLGLVNPTADDLLNANSEFNKNSKDLNIPQISEASSNSNLAPDKK